MGRIVHFIVRLAGRKLTMGLLFLLALPGCDREDLNDLYRRAEENEIMVKHLEETIVNINDQIADLYSLTEALMRRHHLTGKEKTREGYKFTFNDTLDVVVRHGVTPIMEIDPVTGNWVINGQDTDIPAEGKDGITPRDPMVRINPRTLCWEFSTDGQFWQKTTIRAKGETGTGAGDIQVGINGAGNWTIGGIETDPPLRAAAQDGKDGIPPMIDMDKTKNPVTWKYSTDGGETWTSTNTLAEAQNGTDGGSSNNVPYIESVVVIGDSVKFTFSADIPGIVPATRVQKVALRHAEFKITITRANWRTVNGAQWLLFGPNEEQVIEYRVVGRDPVSVDAVNVPGGITASVDQVNKRVILTSAGETAPVVMYYDSFKLLALSSEGTTASCEVKLSGVYCPPLISYTESFVYSAYSLSGQFIATITLVENRGNGVGSFVGYIYAGIATKSCPTPTYYNMVEKPVVLEDIDANRYRIVWVGNNYWMADNLRVEHYNDGTPIQNLTDASAWQNDTRGAYCYYNNDKNRYALSDGALYNAAAVSSGKLAPKGWHVATDEDWKELETYKNGMTEAQADQTGWRGTMLSYYLKDRGGFWGGETESSTMNLYSFSAHPSGMRSSDGQSWRDFGNSGYWWSLGNGGTTYYYRSIGRSVEPRNALFRNNDQARSTGFGVRCVKDK